MSDVLPGALHVGVGYESLLHMNPRVLHLCAENFVQQRNEQMEHDNLCAWLTGRYVLDAIGAAFGKHGKFPQKPYDLREKRPPTMWELREKLMGRAKEIEQAQKD